MSDQEGGGSSPDTEDNCDPDLEGACGGGDSSLRGSTLSFEQLSEPTADDGDNLSMEVNLGEGSSRHASEISSLSYQNLVEEGEILDSMCSHRESDESGESCSNEYPDVEIDFQHEGCTADALADSLTEKLRKCTGKDFGSQQNLAPDILGKRSNVNSRSGSDTLSEGSENIIHFYNFNKRSSGKNTHSKYSDGQLEKEAVYSERNGMSITGDERVNQKWEGSVTLREPKKEPDDGQTNGVKKRNSLEIRNNIPVVGEVKSYDKSFQEPIKYNLQGAKPKIKRQSPGFAHRVTSSGSSETCSDRDGSSSERETTMHNPVAQDNSQIQSTIDSLIRMSSNMTESMNNNRKDVNIENEYDYVKYARIQQGNSYVGMRLAYSSSNDSLNFKRNSIGLNSISSNSAESSRECSPEKVLHQKNGLDSSISNQQVNFSEDTLTEIPLNNAEILSADEKRGFTLSPENTECDSAEIESVVSEEEKSTAGGMPVVEDGLSGSQASDVDEAFSHDTDSPAKILHSKQKAEIEQELNGLDNHSPNCKPKDIDARAIMDDLKAKREALDLAISDIKTAIKKSKNVTMKSPYEEELETAEPVWIMRDNYEKLHRNEEMRRVREEIERQQEEEFARREQEKVYEMESEKDGLLEHQYTRNDGKTYQTPKGYETDDEFEDVGDVRYTRKDKGKKYASIPRDDSTDSAGPRKFASNVMAVRQWNEDTRCTDGVLAQHEYSVNSCRPIAARGRQGSQGSLSEEGGSEAEPPSSSTYVTKSKQEGDFDTDEETDKLLQKQYQTDQHVDIPELSKPPINLGAQAEKRRSRAKEATVNDPDNPTVLIEGVLFRAHYLGSTQLISEGQPSKAMRMMQAQEAVGRIKSNERDKQENTQDDLQTLGTLHFGKRFQAPEGENQPSTEVDLFVSTEKIMVLNTDLQEIMMDHSLRTISYIADIGDILVIMARRRLITSPGDEVLRNKKQQKILCHVFESDEAQLIAQSIGQAFQVAYMEFLKANGIEDPGLIKEMDYQDVLNQQEICGEELSRFTNKDYHREVIVPKLKGEPIGVVIVESGWGSMVPTVVLANMSPNGPAARCGHLNIGDQIISINGVSMVGLPLSTCQTYIKGARQQTVVKLTVVPCPPVVEVLIKRPDVKYQLGFSVQNGVICSLLRGGIAERGGVRVGHRIIEINNQSVVAVPHEKIVSLLANSVGEIHMKTMPTSIFRLLTGQETPHYL